MRTIATSRITPYLVILAGFAMILGGSYQAVAAEITCSICTLSATTTCNHAGYSPGGQPSCYGYSQTECAAHSCRRCDGEFETAAQVCLQSNDGDDSCTLTGETEDCGTKYRRVCEWRTGYNCQCPDSGGDSDGNCQFDECIRSS